MLAIKQALRQPIYCGCDRDHESVGTPEKCYFHIFYPVKYVCSGPFAFMSLLSAKFHYIHFVGFVKVFEMTYRTLL